MANKITALALLIAFMAQTFDKAVIYIDFNINRDYIAKVLCINKEKPQSTCKGTCQLKKKIEEETKKDQSNPDRKSENKIEIVSPINLSTASAVSLLFVCTIYKSGNIGEPIDIPADFFHPPC
jgi:hypothetical protein